MSDDQTAPMTLEAKVDLILVRIAALESNTRPIWERALAEILEVKETVGRIDKRQSRHDELLDNFMQEVIELKRSMRHPV